MSRGFTLLEVLVALVILSLAIVTLIQLASRGLHLLRLADDYHHALLLAERVARASDIGSARVDTGREGPFQWERRVAQVPVPDLLSPSAGPVPHLYALSVAVHWGHTHHLDLASLRTVVDDAGPLTSEGRAQ